MNVRNQRQIDRQMDRNRYPLALMFLVTLYAALVVGLTVQAIRQSDAGNDWGSYGAGLVGILLGGAIGFYHYQPIWGILCGGLVSGLAAFLAYRVWGAAPHVFTKLVAGHCIVIALLVAFTAAMLWRSKDALSRDRESS